MISQSVSRNSIILGLFAVVTTGMIVLTANLTKAKIAEEKENALIRSLLEVMPADLLNNDLLNSTVLLNPDPLLGTKAPRRTYIAKQDEDPSGLILEVVAPEGYGGSISLLVGIAINGTITGVRVIPPHFETPGLGDAIEIQKSPWITSFNGKSLRNLNEKGWHVKKDGGQFDAFTGATITPRAVVEAVHKALLYFDAHDTELLYGSADTTISETQEVNQDGD